MMNSRRLLKIFFLVYLSINLSKSMAVRTGGDLTEYVQKCAKIPSWMLEQSSKIVGGRNATAPIPWQVHIPEAGCGGTIIDRKTILTAAHCDGFAPNMEVKAGKLNHQSSDIQTRLIKKVLKHSMFNEIALFDSDIAILKLDSPLTFNEDVQPACLPDPLFTPESEEKVAYVSGWGRTKQGIGLPGSKHLKYVGVPLIPNEKCVKPLTDYASNEITSNMVCAGFNDGGRDTCQGDSGGPLVVPRTSSDHSAVIYGVTSWGGPGCAKPKRPGVYARVTKFLSWIRNNMEAEVMCDSGEFRCSNGKKCIRNSRKCDGINDCGDNSDERNCPPGTTSEAEVVLITGGSSYDSTTRTSDYFNTSEILNGPEGCTMPDLPNGGTWHHNMIMTANNDILTCGGYLRDYDKKCYQYDKKIQDWIPHSDLKQRRREAASITMPNAVYLFGGILENTYEYMVKDENVWQEGKTSIPGGFREGCVVKLNNNELALVGGKRTESRIMKFNTATKVFTENWGRLKQPRHGHACVTLGNNILVVGGFGARSGSELINIEDGRQSETDVGDLNSKRHNLGLVSLGGSTTKILAIGGGGTGTDHDSVEEYDENTGQWKNVNMKLSEKKRKFGYLAVPSSAVCP